MRRCKNLDSGINCEFFIYGVDENPGWYVEGVCNNGDIIVRDYDGPIVKFLKFSHFFDFIQIYKFIGEQPGCDTEDTNSLGCSFDRVDNKLEGPENSISDIDSAKLWFGSLPAEVCKYLVLRHISVDGTVDIVGLHRSQSF